ncbi:MAG TPA: FAD-binding oxidoreductase [Gemmatimonadaceae bacterium]|nr:FAD-binding oxidoreductase [Gemmatimonadaceae bacterium]
MIGRSPSPDDSAAAGGTPVWDDGDWTPLPPLDGDVDADVCVVGLGGAGLSCVNELIARGVRRVVGVDATAVGGGAGGRNGGFLLAGLSRFHHDVVAAVGRERAAAIYRMTMAEIDRMVAATPSLIRRVGTLRVAESVEEERDCAAQRAAMVADGLPVETYDGPEGRGLLFPTDGAFQPLARCRELARRAVAAGASLYERSPVVSVDGTGVATARGRVRCGAVVVAVDGRLDRLLPELASVVRTARLQMLATAPVREVVATRPVYARWGYDYWQQLPDGRVALGGARDVGGDAEWTTEAVPTPAVQAALERRLRDGLGVHAPITHRWAAVVGYTADALPIAREVRPAVWAVGGYSGTGNVLGSLLGRAVGEAVVGGGAAVLGVFDGTGKW